MTKEEMVAIRGRNEVRKKKHSPPAGYYSDCDAEIEGGACCLEGAEEDIDALLAEIDGLRQEVALSDADKRWT